MVTSSAWTLRRGLYDQGSVLHFLDFMFQHWSVVFFSHGHVAIIKIVECLEKDNMRKYLGGRKKMLAIGGRSSSGSRSSKAE